MLVDARAAVRAHEFAQFVDVNVVLGIVFDLAFALGKTAVLGHDDLIGRDRGHFARLLSHDNRLGIAGHAAFQAGADERGIGAEKRNTLALHVRAHEGAVGVIVLEERDEAGRHGDELLRRDVHVVDLGRLNFEEVSAVADRNFVPDQFALSVDHRVGLGHEEVLLLVGREVFDGIADAAIGHLAVGCFDEAEIVDPGKGAERADQADVRTFRRLDRADAAIVRRVHVADFEPGAVAAETTGPEGGKAAFVGQFGQRIGLIHELAQLGASEEITDHAAEGFRVDQLRGCDVFKSRIEQGHALFDHAFRAGQTGAALVGEKLAHRAHATAAQVVDVVDQALFTLEFEEMPDRGDEILAGHDAVFVRDVQIELEIDFMTPNAAEVILFRVEEHAFEHALGIRHGRRISGAQLAVDVLEGFFLVVRRILAQRLDDGFVRRDIDHTHLGNTGGKEAGNGRFVQRLKGIGQDDLAVLDVLDQHLAGQFVLVEAAAELEILRRVEKADDVLVGRITHGAQKGGGQKFAAALAAVHVNVKQIVRVELHLHPRSAVGNDAETVEDFAVGMHGRLETNAGRTVQLADDDPLGAVDDEGTLRGHERELAHVDFFFLGPLFVLEAEGHVQRRAEGLAFALGLERAELGRANVIARVLEDHLLVVTRDGEDFAKDGLQTGILALGWRDALLQKFLVGIDLQLDEVGRFRGFLEFAEVETIRHECEWWLLRGALVYFPVATKMSGRQNIPTPATRARRRHDDSE